MDEKSCSQRLPCQCSSLFGVVFSRITEEENQLSCSGCVRMHGRCARVSVRGLNKRDQESNQSLPAPFLCLPCLWMYLSLSFPMNMLL